MSCPYCGSSYFPGMSIIGHLLEHAHKQTRITPAELRGRGRSRAVAEVRFAVMAAARHRGMSLPQIGRGLGDRDHTTIINGLRRARELDVVPEFRALLKSLDAA